MQHVQRQSGKILPRVADESRVGLLIKDFDHAVDLLATLINSTKAWQQSWRDILDSQERLAAGFVVAANPIPGDFDDSYNGPAPMETSPDVTRRLARFHQEYHTLRSAIEPALQLIDSRIIGPAQQAKDLTHSMKRTIKTRQNCKLKFELYQSRRDATFKKVDRSNIENLALSRHDRELGIVKDTFRKADTALRDALPRLLSAVCRLMPLLLAALIRIAHTLVASQHTTIHDFCQAESFSIPSPPVSEVISQWTESCKPAQFSIETLASCTNAEQGRMGGIGATSPRMLSSNFSTASGSLRISPFRDDGTPSMDAQSQIRRIWSANFQQGQASLSSGSSTSQSLVPTDPLTPTSTASGPDYFGKVSLHAVN